MTPVQLVRPDRDVGAWVMMYVVVYDILYYCKTISGNEAVRSTEWGEPGKT